jgi:acetate kinase
MNDPILVLNAGSSSLKFSVFETIGNDLELRLRGQVESLYTEPNFVAKDAGSTVLASQSWPEGTQLGHDGAMKRINDFLAAQGVAKPVAVGHRVLHGGLKFSAPAKVDAEVMAQLEQFIPFGPLHQPHNLTPIRLLMEQHPELPQVACFDTAFHRTQPQEAELFALPLEYAEEGIRRYGFHGLSYEYIASVLGQYDKRAATGRTIVLHLGNGASMAALSGGLGVATTMGFTALDGLPMGTRCGAIDPGILLYLMTEKGMDAKAIEKLLYRESGLLGLSGVSSDMRALLASDSSRARLAVDFYVYRISREIGSFAAALGGVDALVFTGGIGENAPLIRARICEAAHWLGLRLDAAANQTRGPLISTEDSAVNAWVIPTNEELMIARHVRRVLKGN